MFWYCIRSKPKQERLAATQLRAFAQIEVFCPMMRYERPSRHGREGKVWITEAMFPGYLFARFDLAEKRRAVVACLGVAGLLAFGGNISTIADDVITELRQFAGEGDIPLYQPSQQLLEGAPVQVTSGKLGVLSGVVHQCLPSRERVTILVQFLGRTVKMEARPEDVCVLLEHPLQVAA